MNKCVVSILFLTIVCCGPLVKNVFSQGCEQAQEFYSEGIILSDGSEQEANFYRQALALCSEYAEAHYRLANVYAGWGQYQEAIAAKRELYDFVETRIDVMIDKVKQETAASD